MWPRRSVSCLLSLLHMGHEYFTTNRFRGAKIPPKFRKDEIYSRQMVRLPAVLCPPSMLQPLNNNTHTKKSMACIITYFPHALYSTVYYSSPSMALNIKNNSSHMIISNRANLNPSAFFFFWWGGQKFHMTYAISSNNENIVFPI